MPNTPTRLTKVTDYQVMLEYKSKGRKVHIVQMGDDGRTPIAWWFEPATTARKRQQAKAKVVTDLRRDLARINKKGSK